MKYMAAVLILAAVAVAAPVEVEKRSDTCTNTANVACCEIPAVLGITLLCDALQPGQQCSGYSYCCENEGDGGIINVNILDCTQIF
ncbi:hypothetical protein J3459_008230 [Metarhizium acridum]|uniref:Hydrophobin n=1 Tax=Metarhizium acridum (strain CQMa 102) TaxID=655827 RepID=E9EF52_METAQ|nr:uncharacterized protein MAC_08500 [Metarhizium acridum CQMa 102]EFY85435.1 hypothetical protein MAC_08500 [Metarhizium acridum CQMa 102]KAG8408273.1 hypothetical protein J3459_018044 [Metarhizium acridum]KAG8426316.1 hypothetical protein J3459_008230 [Metarhizium acridum]